MKGYIVFYSGPDDAGRRADRVIKKFMPEIPAGLIYSAMRKKKILINGKKIKPDYRLSENDRLEIHQSIREANPAANSSDGTIGSVYKTNSAPNSSRLDAMTVLRTENLIFLNKPRGMLTHGDNSAAGLLKSELKPQLAESLSFTPAPLHRLDRNTSGLLAASCSIRGARDFSERLRSGGLRKFYIGLCLGNLKKSIVLEDSLKRSELVSEIDISGDSDKKAVTIVHPFTQTKGFTLCIFEIITGLTHQIRAQVSAAGYPLAGDAKYNGTVSGFKRYFLHSYMLINPEKTPVMSFDRVTAIPDTQSCSFLEKHIDCNISTDFFNRINSTIISL